MNRKVMAGIITVIVFLSALGIYVVAFTSIGRAVGRPANNCSQVSKSLQSSNNDSLTISVVGNQSVTPTGAISWCIYGTSGHLLKGYQTNRILSDVAYSANGEYVAASGYKLVGPYATLLNGSVYLFNKNGQMKWSISSPEPINTVEINGNGSVIMTSDSVLLYINNQGKVLWNYSNTYELPTVGALVDNGSKVIAGISSGPFSGPIDGSSLIMFNNNGNILWNVSLPDLSFDSSSTLAVSNGYIAAGLSNTGYNGTLNYYNLQGKLIWSRDVASSIQNVNFTSNQSTIFVKTNWGNDTFDLSGNVIQNQTAPHPT